MTDSPDEGVPLQVTQILSAVPPYGTPPVSARPGEYLTDRLTRRARRFIREHADHPFLLVLSLYAVHQPIQCKPELLAKYQAKSGRSGLAAAYAGMVEGVDQCVGAVLDELDQRGLREDTLVIFTSDNGGLERESDPSTLRGGKGWLYEGGVRVPLMVSLPGVIEPGDSDVPVSGVDIAPTILHLTGAWQAAPECDGSSLLELIGIGEAVQREALYWHYPHYSNLGGPPCGAVLSGRLKLIEFFEDQRVELYDVLADPKESRDLAELHPEECRRLRSALHEWRRSIDAQMPTPAALDD